MADGGLAEWFGDIKLLAQDVDLSTMLPSLSQQPAFLVWAIKGESHDCHGFLSNPLEPTTKKAHLREEMSLWEHKTSLLIERGGWSFKTEALQRI